ncbi:MAG: DUF3298 and DUF4163 domain-containing protein [Tepidanaerobacteraceae bacterium]
MIKFRILMLLCTVLLLTMIFPGCSNYSNLNSNDTAHPENTVPTPSTDTSPAADKALALKISYNVYSDTIKDDDGTDLVNFKFSYPHIDNPNNAEGITAINNYYETQFNHFLTTIVPKGKNAALEFKKVAMEAGFDFYPLAFEREASIYYNHNNLLSVLNMEYENTGGAHPNSYWSSETFDVKTGKTLALSDIFGLSQEESLEKVYEIVISQIEASKEKDNYYFEDYEENVKNYYSENDFILSPEGIIFYFQHYAIAPYAAGIPTFELPYEDAEDLSIEILALKPNNHQREIYLQAGRLIEANKEVFCNIFGLSMLPLELPENFTGEAVFPIKDSRFVTFSDLDNYMRGIYVKSEADTLMNSGRYIDKDGRLHGDINKDTGMGYYIDWNNYRFEVNETSESSAIITIYVVDDSPAGKEETTIEVKMLKENDRWLLEKMFY